MWLMRVLTFSVSSAWTTRPRALVHQQQVLVFVHDVQLGTEHGEEDVFLRGLVKELIVDI